MSRYETEEEQIEAIKSWWKKHGTQLLSAILVAVIAFSGWRYWQQYQYTNAANASAIFEALQVNMQQGTFGEVSREGLKLIQEQPESPYAAAAALLLAKYHYEKEAFAEAQQHLQWVVDHSSDVSLQQVAQLRLARLLADQGEFVQAQEILDQVDNGSLSGTQGANFDYVAGLVALGQSDLTAAKAAFEQVMANPSASQSLQGIAQIQLDDLPK
jgi:predicted negative regulator of RcsB-dependent stress response